MPVGTYGTVKAMAPARARRDRRADRARQHVPPLAAPGARGHRRARRAAPLHGLARGRSSPTPADSRCSSLGPLRKVHEDGVAFASPVNGDKLFLTPELSMQIQRTLDVRHRDGVRRVHAVSRDARRGGARRWSFRCAGRGARAPSSTRLGNPNALFGIVQGGMYDDLRDASLAALDRRSASTATRSAGCRWASRRRRCCACSTTIGAAPARGPAALSDGRGHAGGPGRRRRGRHRHVRLRAADAQRAQRLAVHALRRRQDPQRAPPRPTPARSTPPAAATPAAISRAATCITCSASTRSWARGSHRSTTSTTTSR